MATKTELTKILAEYLDQTGFIMSRRGTLPIHIKVIRGRFKFGRLDLYVEALDGHGSAWVVPANITLDKQPMTVRLWPAMQSADQ